MQKHRPLKLTDKQLDKHYEASDLRLTQDRNDFLLPQIIDYVNSRRWINLHPEYQRRLVWDDRKKSLFVESLLLNVPVPPIFLYEYDLNRYEVMDGQQRLNTIVEFYEGNLTLTGLERWAALNGRTYKTCPPRVKSGFDRRRLSATVVTVESVSRTKNQADDIRRLVFERLNTGGQQLNAQELRNCLFSGPFNDLLIMLSGLRLFTQVWGIPPHKENLHGSTPTKTLAENRLYRRMIDCEIVLRYFAFRHKNKIKGAVRSILDDCMEEARSYSAETVSDLAENFKSRLSLANEIFGKDTFRIMTDEANDLSQPLYDAVMVSLDRLWNKRSELKARSVVIRKRLRLKLKNDAFYELVVGKPNTAKAIKARIDAVEKLLLRSTK